MKKLCRARPQLGNDLGRDEAAALHARKLALLELRRALDEDIEQIEKRLVAITVAPASAQPLREDDA